MLGHPFWINARCRFHIFPYPSVLPYFTNRSVFYGDICMREKELRLMIRKEPTRIREHVDMVRVFKDAANTHEFPRRYR